MDWSIWRREFPITEHGTHFNHAGVSPVSRRVATAVSRFITEATVVDRDTQRRWEERTEMTRGAIARLINAQASAIAVAKNKSAGRASVAAGGDRQRDRQVRAPRRDHT